MSQENSQTPPYTVRHSARARRASIRVLPGRGVEVVLPQGVDAACAGRFVQAKAGWIRKTMRRLAMDEDSGPLLPERIVLQAIGQCWEVRYGSQRQRRLKLVENAGALQFLGGSQEATEQQDAEERCAMLQSWLKAKARENLPAWVRSLEGETGLVCSSVQVRLQRTRWGSCSSRGALSLNASLLFLPPEQARYVLLHELCHTRHLNHSAKFWKLLCSVEPRAREIDALLHRAWTHVPVWVSRR